MAKVLFFRFFSNWINLGNDKIFFLKIRNININRGLERLKIKFRNLISDFFTKGHERSLKAKKNIIASLLIRGISIISNFALVPITIQYVNPTRYGIWITISSIVAWLSFFDLGLSNGFKNKFAEAKSKGNIGLAQSYVSTTYITLLVIFGLFWFLFIICNNYLDWTRILNAPVELVEELSTLAFIVFSYFCLRFVLSTISILLIANQSPAKATLIDAFSNLLTLLIVFVLTKSTEGSLIYLGLALCIPPIVVLLFANIIFFNGSFKLYRPKICKFKASHLRSLMGLGMTFFFIQIAVLVQFQSANFIITHFFGPSEVTPYNIAFRYFSLISIMFGIIITPFWSSTTEAYAKGDIEWIKNAVHKYKKIWIGCVIVGLIMLSCSNYVYDLWIGIERVKIHWRISLWCLINVVTVAYSSIFIQPLNGIGAIKIQIFTTFLSPIFFLSLSYYFIVHLSLGVYSVLMATFIANFWGIIVAPLQYKKVFLQKKKGLWIK